MFTVLYIDDPEFTDDVWQRYFESSLMLHKKYKTFLNQSSWSEWKRSALSYQSSEKTYHEFVVRDNRQVVGRAWFHVRKAGTADQSATLTFNAMYDEIPREFTRAVGAEAVRLLDRYAFNTVFCMCTDQRTSRAARQLGGRELNRLDRYRLYRKTANYALLDDWLRTIPTLNAGLRLDFFTSIPEEYLARYVSLSNQFFNDMPKERGEGMPFHFDVDEVRRHAQWRKMNGWELYTYALFDQRNEMVAHSSAPINVGSPQAIYQLMTGVDREYRGRGLSKWLKAALFKKIGEDFPGNETMTTDMRAVNEPIQRVNKQMGYVLENEGNEFEINVENLRSFLRD